MKLDKFLVAVTISIFLLAGLFQVFVVLYTQYVPNFALTGLGVAGFLGWATFYAAGGKEEGFVKGLATNMTGIFWGIIIVLIWKVFGFNTIGAFIAVGIGAGMLCFQAHIKVLSFIPGAFIGTSTFFALGALVEGSTIYPAVIGLIMGLSLGYISEKFAIYINSKLVKE